MSSMGYDVVKSIVRRKLLFIPVYPLLQEPKQRSDYSKKLMDARELFENEVIVIDSFTTFIKYDIDPKSIVSLVGFFKRIVALDFGTKLPHHPHSKYVVQQPDSKQSHLSSIFSLLPHHPSKPSLIS